MAFEVLHIRALEQIQSSLKAATDDLNGEERALRDGDGINEGMLDGALHHAEAAIRSLKLLQASVQSAREMSVSRREEPHITF